MKKFLILLCLTIMLACTACIVGCNNDSDSTPPDNTETPSGDTLKNFSGITFEDQTFTYDAAEHIILISGNLPDNTYVSYTNNSATDAGTYNATATLTNEEYNTLTLTATLKINKATFGNDIQLPDETIIYDGNVHSLAITGTLPPNTVVRYENNDRTDAGEYTVKAILENPNYITKTLTAQLNIRALPDALNIIVNLLSRPNAWNFMPDAFLPENMAYTAAPQSDFSSSFVSVDKIETKSIGKQLNVVYDLLNQVQSILSKANVVFGAGETIASVYQTFINDNPDSYSQFTKTITIGGVEFNLKIALSGDVSILLIGNDTISVELTADSENNINIGRIQIASGVLKYESSATTLKLAIDVEISGVKVAQSIEFVRSNNAVAGYLYEYYGVGDTAIKTTALISCNEIYTVIVGNKRETDDLLIEAYEEVYDSRTGKMIGCEVAETVKAVDFDTLWFHLSDTYGFTNVKVEDTANGLNADTVYINNSTTAFKTKNIGGFGLDTLSRRYDIEMKEVWYIVEVTENDGSITYEKVKQLVPMLFVQTKSVSTFSFDVTAENDCLTSAILPSATPMTSVFETMKTTYESLKDITYQDITDFIGNKNSFFS